MVLSALTKGLPPKELDPLSMEFLQSCARNLALRLSNENIEKEKQFLGNWNIENAKVCKSYAKKVIIYANYSCILNPQNQKRIAGFSNIQHCEPSRR